MTHTVYPVKGGLEDWAYGGWDTKNVPKCQIKSPPQYRLVNTPYKPAMLKAFIYLVEASDEKNPKNVAMGSVRDVLKPGGGSDGHISRNVRMSLDFIRAAAPYVSVKRLSYNPETKMASVEYQAEGCFEISETDVKVSSCLRNRLGGKKDQLGGVCTWANAKLNGNRAGKLTDPTKSVVGTWKVSDPSKPISLKIRLSCDQNWSKPPAGTQIQPVSHLVNIRTKAQTQEIKNNGFSLKSYKNVEYNIGGATPARFASYQFDHSSENKMSFIDRTSKLTAGNNGLKLSVEQKSEKSLRITLSPNGQASKFENSQVYIQMHKAGSGQFTTSNCKLAKFGNSRLKCDLPGYHLIDLLGKPILIKKGNATLFTAKLEKGSAVQGSRILKTTPGWHRRRVLANFYKRNRNLAAIPQITPKRKTQISTPTKKSLFVHQTISRLNNLTYGNSCVVAGCVSLFIVICMVIYLRNTIVKLFEIYRQDKGTKIVTIDRKADFDSMSSLSGGTDDKGKVLSADFGENRSQDNLDVADSAQKKLKFTGTINA